MEIVKIKLYMYMKNIFQSLSIATLLGLFVPFISSCSDDEEVFNEWNATYVSLQRNDYLSGNVKKFNLTHDANGIGGDEIKMAFTVKTQKAVSTDMVIALSAKKGRPRVEMDNGRKETQEFRNRSGESARHPGHSSNPDSPIPPPSPGTFSFPERISFLIR